MLCGKLESQRFWCCNTTGLVGTLALQQTFNGGLSIFGHSTCLKFMDVFARGQANSMVCSQGKVVRYRYSPTAQWKLLKARQDSGHGNSLILFPAFPSTTTQMECKVHNAARHAADDLLEV